MTARQRLNRDDDLPEIRAEAYDKLDDWRAELDQTPKLKKRDAFERAAADLFLEAEYEHDLAATQAITDAVYFLGRDYTGLGDDDIQYIMVGAKAKAERPINGHGKPHNGGQAGGARSILIRTAAALRTKIFDPIKFIVPGFIVEGCTILAGRPKLGKSWFMLDAGLAVARGEQCLGAQCDEGDVLYLAMEDNERRLQSRMTKLMGYGREWPARFHYATEWPRANAGGLDKIREWIAAAGKPRLVVVDVLAMFRSPRDPKQSPYESDYEAVQALQRIASDTGVAIVIVHHLRKSAAEVDPFEKVSGTLGLSGGVDTVLILDRNADGATIYGRGRDIEEIEKAVEFVRETCRWRVLGAAADVRRSDERNAILGALAETTEPLSPREVADLTGHSYDAVRQTLIRMAKAGEVKKTKRGQYACDTQPPCHNGHNVTTDEKIATDEELKRDCDFVTAVTPP
jgi:hypothetical protein